MFSKTSGQLLREHTRNPRHLDLHPHTRHRKMFMRQDCCARTPQAHLDHVPAKRLLLRSHAASTLGSHFGRKETCSIEKTAAVARCEHTWISLRAQTDLFMRQHCCALTPRAHLDLSPCARRPVHATTLLRSHAVSTLGSHFGRKKHVPAKRLLRSHAASTLGSRSVHKETSCAAPEMDEFYLRTPNPVSTVKCAHVPYVIGNP